MNKQRKIYSLDDFEDGQSVYLKSRGEVVFEKNHFGNPKHGAGFRNGPGSFMHPYASVYDIFDLMSSHGFFLNEADYIEWKQLWGDANICKCCLQEKYNQTRVETGKEVYLERKIYE